MCQAIAARKRRRSRRSWRPPCSRGHLVSAVLAALLLFDVCDGYMSTMHLGRTLKALRARELEQEQEQQEHGSLPPGASAPPSPDQQYTAEEIQEDSPMAAAAAAGPVAGEHENVVGTHPSWAGAPDDNGEPADTQGKATTTPADTAADDAPGFAPGFGEEATGGVDLAGEGVGAVEEEESEREFNLSTSPVTAAATTAATAAGAGVGGLASASHRQSVDTGGRTEWPPGEAEEDSKPHGVGAERLSLAGDQEDDEETGEEAVTGRVAAGASVAGVTGVLDEGSSSSSIPADHHTVATEVEVGLTDGVGSTVIAATAVSGAKAAAAAAAATATTPAQQQDNELEETEEEEDDNDEENEYYEEQEEEVMGEEEVEAAAIREILSQRAARDLEVQAAAARAVEALPATQRECFEEVKAFAFGGAGGDGDQEGLSEEEVAALDTVAICGDRDGVVLAFLRHSKFDVRKAKESMRRCCAWRRENEANGIFERAVSPAKMKKHRTHWPTGFHKEDRAGRPVFYDRVGQSDLTKLRAEPDGLDQDEMVQIFTQNMEARRRFVLTRLSREAGHPVDQMTTVLDLTGLGMRHMSTEAVSYTRRISDVFQDNYSGMTCSLLILNAPWVFSKGWQVIEGFLSEDTVAKVKVLGKGEAGLAQLEEYIPKENIPEFLGGESPAIIGPSDPLWADVDSAVRSWASGGDPFLDRAEVDRVSRRIRREREQSLRAKSKSKSKAKAKAEPKVGAPLLEEEEERREEAPPATAAAAGGDDGGRRRVRARASRRAAVAAGGRPKSYGSGSGRRSKTRRHSPEDAVNAEEDTKLVREDTDKETLGQKKKKNKHRRQRGGLVSSSSSSIARRPSSSSSRRRTTTPPSSLPSPPTKTTATSAASAASRSDALGDPAGVPARAKGSSGRRGSILRGPAAQEALGSSSSSSRGEGVGKKDRGRRSHKGAKAKKSVRWEDDHVAETEEEEDEADDDGSSRAMDARGSLGERVLEGLGGGVVPVLRAWFSQLLAGLLAAGRILLSSAEKVFRFLRDTFFEQVEVED